MTDIENKVIFKYKNGLKRKNIAKALNLSLGQIKYILFKNKCIKQQVKQYGEKNHNWKKKISIICNCCKKIFSVIPSREHIAKFCSKLCRNKYYGYRNNTSEQLVEFIENERCLQ